jgi:RNA polymerase sigma-32 factor
MARDRSPELSHYISAAHDVPRLTREREDVIVARWFSDGDIAARDELVRAHLRYVVASAFKYRRYGVPLDELIAEGNYGVVHALKKFDPARGNRFVTYAAYWIRAYVLNYVIRSWSMVGVGSGALRSKMFFKLRRERARIVSLLGEGDAADEALAAKLSLPKERVLSMVRRLESRDVSLDTRLFDDSGATMLDTLPAAGPSQEDSLERRGEALQIRAWVQNAIKALDTRERYIVENRLMADREDGLSLAEIGRQLGVSRERARQLEARAKRKLQVRITEITANEGTGLLEHAGVLEGGRLDSAA